MICFLNVSDWKGSPDLAPSCGSAAVCLKGWANISCLCLVGKIEDCFFQKEKLQLPHKPGFGNCIISVYISKQFKQPPPPPFTTQTSLTTASSEDRAPISFSILRSPWEKEGQWV